MNCNVIFISTKHDLSNKLTLFRPLHMWRRWVTPQNFCLTFINELENSYLIKRLLKWVNNKCKNFNINNAVFLNDKEKHLEISSFTTVYQKYWDIERNRLKLVIMFFSPFHPLPLPPPPKNRKKIGFLKKWEKQLQTSSFYALYQKPQSYEVWFLIQSETDIIFCQIGLFFSLLPPPLPPP